MFNVARSFIVAAIVAAGLVIMHQAPASAQLPPVPCDFITGGGFVVKPLGARVNFGAHGGCKHGEFWGHVNVVDHGGFLGKTPYHIKSTQITGYVQIGLNVRDICGIATTNADEPQPVRFRVRMTDNGEPGTADRFGIRLSNTYLVISSLLEDGNIELHKPNPSTAGPDPVPDFDTMCAGVGAPVGGGGGPDAP